MAEPMPLTLWATAMKTEGPAITSAAKRLHQQLTEAGQPVHLKLRWLDPLACPDETGPQVAIMSMLTELGRRPEPQHVTLARWRARIEQLQDAGLPCMLCTVFRHVPDHIPGLPSEWAESILRLNLTAVQLSQETGASVADIDRALAEVGARRLGTDFRIGQGWAASIAGHTIARTLLMEGLIDQLPADTLDSAVASLGTLRAFIKNHSPHNQ